MALLISFTFSCALRIAAGGVDGVAQSSVFQDVQPLSDEALRKGDAVDFRLRQLQQLAEHALASRGDLVIVEHKFGAHPLEHADGGFSNLVVREIHLLEDTAQIRETAAIVGAQDALVGDVEPLDNIHHVVPPLEGKKRAALRERSRLLRGFLSIAVEGFVQIGDRLRLAERFNEEGIVGPSGTWDLLESFAVFFKKFF